jgi:hypothetical protein
MNQRSPCAHACSRYPQEASQADPAPAPRTLKQKLRGARDLIVRDPDGNLLLFAGPAA